MVSSSSKSNDASSDKTATVFLDRRARVPQAATCSVFSSAGSEIIMLPNLKVPGSPAVVLCWAYTFRDVVSLPPQNRLSASTLTATRERSRHSAASPCHTQAGSHTGSHTGSPKPSAATSSKREVPSWIGARRISSPKMPSGLRLPSPTQRYATCTSTTRMHVCWGHI